MSYKNIDKAYKEAELEDNKLLTSLLGKVVKSYNYDDNSSDDTKIIAVVTEVNHDRKTVSLSGVKYPLADFKVLFTW